MATTYTQAPIIKRQYLDSSGNPLASGKIYTLSSGGTWPADAITTFQTASGTAHSNPIILDSAGRIPGSSELFLRPGQSYKFIGAEASGDYTSPLWTEDGISAVPASTVNTDVEGTAGEALTANQAVYLNTTTWMLADADAAATSTSPPIGFVVTSVANGASGTFRLSGRMDGFAGLIPGSDYYLSATAGAITTTAPSGARYVGRADSASSLIIAPNPPVLDAPSAPQGRLTLTSNTPVTTSDVTAATTLYFTPFGGNRLHLYNGTTWTEFRFSQLSIAVPATTNQMYDVFVYNNAGALTLELTAWTNDTTRATALTTQDGVYVKSGATSRLWLGSFRTTTVSGQTEDSVTKRLVYNYYNRVPRRLLRYETTASWNYTTATIRQANGSTSNQVAIVQGVAETPIALTLCVGVQNTTGVTVASGVGEDSTSTLTAGNVGQVIVTPTSGLLLVLSQFEKVPAEGYHFYSWNEYSAASGTTTWYANGNGTSATSPSSGLIGSVTQ